MSPSQIFQMDSLNQLESVASEISTLVHDGSVLLMSGPMGAGKTTFVQAFTRARFGTIAGVQSPTFTLENVYTLGSRSIFHLDLYRLKGWEDWLTLAVLDRPNLNQSVYCVEWADRFTKAQWEAYFLGSDLRIYNLRFSDVQSCRSLEFFE